MTAFLAVCFVMVVVGVILALADRSLRKAGKRLDEYLRDNFAPADKDD